MTVCMLLKLNHVLFFILPVRPGFRSYLTEFLYYIFPVSVVPPEERVGLFETLNYSLFMFFYAGIKAIGASWLAVYFSMCLDEKGVARTHDSWAVVTLYTGAWLCYLGVSTWTWDIPHSLVNLVSLGRLKLLRINNRPLLSHSVRNFWSARYAVLVRLFIHDTIFSPAIHGLGLSAPVAASIAWFATGAVHALGAYTVFGAGHWTTMLLFVLHATITAVET